MANSKYEYVRAFERDEVLLPNTWIVVRVDGRGFHKLSNYYQFAKPNDQRALELMNAAAVHVVTTMPDMIIAYGVSDEFSFVFHRSTTLFERRAAKLVSTVVSTFTAAYVALWGTTFGGRSVGGTGKRDVGAAFSSAALVSSTGPDLTMLPTFDGRAVCYPTWENLRDYLNWRQVDCHINNLYNTTFWAMVQQGGMTATAAEEELKGTVAADKNEILFSRFQINYNNEPDMYKKGSVVVRDYELVMAGSERGRGKGNDDDDDDGEGKRGQAVLAKALSKTQKEKDNKARQKAKVVVLHVDIIKDEFWDTRPWLKTGRPGKVL